MKTQSFARSKNSFLSVLPEEDFNRLQPHLERFSGEIGSVVHKPDEPLQHVYFPENSAVSIITFLEDGSNIETGIVGNEGFAGIGVVLSDDVSPREATIQLPGDCLKMKAQIFKAEFERSETLRRLALRFVFAFIEQVSQNAACTNRHRIEARLARWLLTLHDRADGDELRITQEFIAQMLGVNRPSVSESAARLQENGFIRYARGRIAILDRAGLENTACECYETIKHAYHKYLNG